MASVSAPAGSSTMHPRPFSRPPLRAAILALGLALTLTAAGCGDDQDSPTTVTAPLGAGGQKIPPTTTAAAAPTPTVTTANGAPGIRQFAAPKTFFCMAAHPNQAQVTIGWSVPNATAVDVRLDGKVLHEGIRKALPFAVPAGPPTGIGSTIVFPCRPDRTHTVKIRWRSGSSPTSERTVKITKAKGA